MIKPYTELIFKYYGIPTSQEVIEMNQFILNNWSNYALLWIKDKAWDAANKIVDHAGMNKGYNHEKFMAWLETQEGRTALEYYTA